MINRNLKLKAQKRKAIINNCLLALLMVIIFLIMLWAIGNALDESIDNENARLCRDAKISGNLEYQTKCKPYYEGGDIKELR